MKRFIGISLRLIMIGPWFVILWVAIGDLIYMVLVFRLNTVLRSKSSPLRSLASDGTLITSVAMAMELYRSFRTLLIWRLNSGLRPMVRDSREFANCFPTPEMPAPCRLPCWTQTIRDMFVASRSLMYLTRVVCGNLMDALGSGCLNFLTLPHLLICVNPIRNQAVQL